MVKFLPANKGDSGLIPRSGRSPGEGNGNPLQYCCLENPMDQGAWLAVVHWQRVRHHLATEQACSHSAYLRTFSLSSRAIDNILSHVL